MDALLFFIETTRALYVAPECVLKSFVVGHLKHVCGAMYLSYVCLVAKMIVGPAKTQVVAGSDDKIIFICVVWWSIASIGGQETKSYPSCSYSQFNIVIG